MQTGSEQPDPATGVAARYRLFYLLQVPTTASEEEIHSAFLMHVHRLGGLIENVPAEIKRAYDILVDPGRRQAYLDLIRLANERSAFWLDDPDVRMLFDDICHASGMTLHEVPREAGFFKVCFPGGQPEWMSGWGRACMLYTDLHHIAAVLQKSRTAKRVLHVGIALIVCVLTAIAVERTSSAVAVRRHGALLDSIRLQCVSVEQEIEGLRAGLALLETEFHEGIGVTLDDSHKRQIPSGIDSLILRHEPVKNAFANIETVWLAIEHDLEQNDFLEQAKERLSAGNPTDTDEKTLRQIAESLKTRKDQLDQARLDLAAIVDIIKTEQLAP